MSTSDQPLIPRPSPCASCPYRRSVPSGIWSVQEYDKLPAYDGDIPEQLADPQQSTRVFTCHQSGEQVCAGWLGHREHPEDLLAVRLGLTSSHLDPSCLDYTTEVDLFDSGAEAAEHGKQDIDAPGERARVAIDKVRSVRSRTNHPLSSD